MGESSIITQTVEEHSLISIITVSYNAVSVIEETILSVINQTYPNVEYIIIDGGSTDGTVDIIKKYSDQVAYWVSEPDKGIYNAMNKGITYAHGEFLNFMNAGDSFYEKDVLSKVFKDKREEDFLVGIAKYGRKYWKPIYFDFKLSDVYHGLGVNHQASFIRKDLLREGYDENARIIADELLFLDKIVFEGYKYAPLPYIVCTYDPNGLSNQKENLDEIQSERMLFLTKRLPKRIMEDYDKFAKITFGKLLWNFLRRRVWLIK